MVKKKGLGKGLGALLSDENSSIDSDSISEIKIVDIEPDSLQPRQNFDDEKLAELADSIKTHGVISPILVHESENGFYKIIAGERRWRAAKLAGLKKIPAIIKRMENLKVYEVALIENLQRQDLTPIEEAKGFKRLMEDYGLTQEQVSERVSKSRSSIANSLRLLNLPKEIIKLIESNEISVGHSKVLLGMEDEDEQIELANKICSDGLSVRETEEIIKKLSNPPKKKSTPKVDLNVKLAFETIEKKFASALGTKVKIIDKNNKGKIQIEYYSAKDLERIISIIENSEKNDL